MGDLICISLLQFVSKSFMQHRWYINILHYEEYQFLVLSFPCPVLFSHLRHFLYSYIFDIAFKAIIIINYYSHFPTFLFVFVDVLKFTLQNHSSLPVIRTRHVSAQLAIIRCISCRINCCPFVTLLHFEFQRCKIF
jgi:hypothetical protein